VLTEARVLVFYLKMIVMPSISELGLYHDDISISRGLLEPPSTLPALLLLAGLLGAALALRTRQPLISLGILWFFSGHILESTVLSLEIAHEHRNYLADYGILLAICALALLARRQRLWRVVRIAGLAAFLLFSATTLIRAQQWSDNVNHAVYEARHHPLSPRAQLAAGRIYARMTLARVPDSEAKAFEFLARASELDASEIIPDVTYMLLKFHLDQPVTDDMYDRIKHKLASYPVSASDVVSLQTLVDCFGKSCDIPEQQLEDMFHIALEQTYSSKLNAIYGVFKLNHQADFQAGLAIFTRVLEEQPRDPQFWINLMKLLLVMQRFDAAEQLLARFDQADVYGGKQATREVMSRALEEARKAAGLQARHEPGEGTL